MEAVISLDESIVPFAAISSTEGSGRRSRRRRRRRRRKKEGTWKGRVPRLVSRSAIGWSQKHQNITISALIIPSQLTTVAVHRCNALNPTGTSVQQKSCGALRLLPSKYQYLHQDSLCSRFEGDTLSAFNSIATDASVLSSHGQSSISEDHFFIFIYCLTNHLARDQRLHGLVVCISWSCPDTSVAFDYGHLRSCYNRVFGDSSPTVCRYFSPYVATWMNWWKEGHLCT